jgi:molybdopterin molybdotransferase
MIPVSEAIDKIKANTKRMPVVKVWIAKASGLVLAKDVFANYSVPNFNQAAVDGYAFRYDDLNKTKEFIIANEVAAGDSDRNFTPLHHASRIFTGAPVPKDLDTIVMQEKVKLQGNKIVILDEELEKGSYVRLAGSEIEKGDLALKKGDFLSPAAIGFSAAIGVSELFVYPKPIVHIIVTGKELVKPGQFLNKGQVFESNSLLLQSALNQLHIYDITVHSVGDDLNETTQAISNSIATADLILLTGGVSVGNYDFVVKAADACGIEQLFHKVKQRPGKPLYAGRKENKIVFGLPGNPASVLTCFYNYVITAIECMTGQQNLTRKKWLPLSTSFSKKVALTQFLKAVCDDKKVTPLTAQESFRLSSFSIANCLIVLPEEKSDFVAGDFVETLVLPYL